jgi:hypothetical protein
MRLAIPLFACGMLALIALVVSGFLMMGSFNEGHAHVPANTTMPDWLFQGYVTGQVWMFSYFVLIAVVISYAHFFVRPKRQQQQQQQQQTQVQQP